MKEYEFQLVHGLGYLAAAEHFKKEAQGMETKVYSADDLHAWLVEISKLASPSHRSDQYQSRNEIIPDRLKH